MKKILFTTAIVAIVLFSASPALAAATMTVTGPASASLGSQFTVNVNVNSGGEAINAVDVNLNFDKSKITVASVSDCASGWDTEATSEYNNANGTVTYTCSRAEGVAFSGTLLTVTFNANAAGTASVSVDNSSKVLRESDSTDILTHPVSSSINVQISQQPTAPVGQPTYTPLGYVSGLAGVGPAKTAIISLAAAAVLVLLAVLILRVRKAR